CNDVVVGALDHVGVADIIGRQLQPPGEHDRGDPCAGLAVGTVGRQLPVVAETFVLVPGPHAAGDVGAALDGGSPLLLHSSLQVPVTGVDCDVHGPGGEVERTHRVAAQHSCLAHGHVVLEVGGPQQRDRGEGAM